MGLCILVEAKMDFLIVFLPYFYKNIYFMIVCMHTHTQVWADVWESPDEGIRSLGAGVIGACEPHVDVGKWTQVPLGGYSAH